MSRYWVYVLASRRNGTLYTGVTDDLARRMEEHKRGLASGFTRRYGVTRLVYAEPHEDISAARAREAAIKHWQRAWKINLIQERNPEWRALTDEIMP